MTSEEFKKQSDELFFHVKKSFGNKLIEAAELAVEKASQVPDKTKALQQLSTELISNATTLSFEASCDYSENLLLLLFDQFFNERTNNS